MKIKGFCYIFNFSAKFNSANGDALEFDCVHVVEKDIISEKAIIVQRRIYIFFKNQEKECFSMLNDKNKQFVFTVDIATEI